MDVSGPMTEWRVMLATHHWRFELTERHQLPGRPKFGKGLESGLSCFSAAWVAIAEMVRDLEGVECNGAENPAPFPKILSW